MSNFEFVNNPAFLSYPSCKRIYEYAMQVECNFYSDHIKSALNVRFFLEQYCIFVSELKNAKYPGKIVVLGDYWNRNNFIEFGRVFGKEKTDIIKELNITSRSYAHSELEDREDLYPNIVRHIYVLLLWLYKDLGLQTDLLYTDYSESKICKNSDGVVSPEGVYFSSEQMRNNISKFFPDCNEQAQYTVEKMGEKYVIRDNKNQVIEELVPPKAPNVSEEDISKMQEDLGNKAKEIETLRSKLTNEKKKYETQIDKLQDELAELSMRGNSSIDSLKRQLEEVEREGSRKEKQYQDKIRGLQKDYSSLYEKYEQLVPEQKLREELQQRIKKLAKERTELRRNFSVAQEKLLTEIEQMQKRLSGANDALVSVNASVSERDSVIKKLQNELHEKEILLLNVQNEAASIFDRLQGETNELTKKYASKVNNLEIILLEIEEENLRYKEQLAKMNKTQEIKLSLRVVRCGVARLEEGYSLYRTHANEQKLRALLLQVKDYYESQIDELKEKLDEKEKELEETRKSKEIIVEQFQELGKEEEAVTKEILPSHKLIFVLALCAIILFGGVAFLLGKLNGIEDKELSNSSGQANNSDGMVVDNLYTPVPQMTNTPIPIISDTPIPTATDTPIPTTTNTPMPTATNTPMPTATNTPMPTATSTPMPTATNTPIPSKLQELIGNREWANSRPKNLAEIQGIDKSLLKLIESEVVLSDYNTFYNSLEYLGEADIYSVANKDARIFTTNEYPWLTFCWTSSKQKASTVIFYVEPAIISSYISRETLKSEIIEFLGEPTNIYGGIGWSDFNFFDNTEEVEDYEWVYEKDKYDIRLRFFFCGERIIDYCQVIIDVD